MKQKRFSDEQIIGILKEADAGAVALDLCRKHGMSSATFYAWKSKYGGLELSEARRLRGLEEENAKLKRLLAEAMLDNAGLKDLLEKNSDARCQARSGRAPPGQPWGERAAGVQHHWGGPEKHPVSAAARRRRRSAWPPARVGPAASALQVPAAAHPAAAGRREDQPQEDAAAVHRGGVDRAQTQVETARSRRTGALAGDCAAERALVARLRARPARGRQAVPRVEFAETPQGFAAGVDDVTRECLAAVVDTSISGTRVAREPAHLVVVHGKPTTIVALPHLECSRGLTCCLI